MRDINKIMGAAVVLSLVMNIAAVWFVPETIVTHWNGRGEPDGSMTKIFGLFMLTGIISMIAVIFAVLPRLKGIAEHMKQWGGVYAVTAGWFIGFLIVINAHIVLWNTGMLKMNPVILGAYALIVFVVIFAGALWRMFGGPHS